MATTNDLISTLMKRAYKTFEINNANSQCHKKLVENHTNNCEQNIDEQNIDEQNIDTSSVSNNNMISNVDNVNISNNEKIDFDTILFRAFFN